MSVEDKVRSVVENVVARYVIGFGFDGIKKHHDFQANAKPLHLTEALIKDINENLGFGTVIPQFDAMIPAQEALAIKICEEIAGKRGEKGSPPDPVRLLEMADALYKAEING